MKRIDFWGRDEYDERLLEEVLRGVKTVTCTPKVWYDQLPNEEKSEIGDIIQVFTKRNEHKANLKITDFYEIRFGEIQGKVGERIAKGENSTLDQFIEDHIFSWEKPLEIDGYELNEDTIIVVEHFQVTDIFTDVTIDLHLVPMTEAEGYQIINWTDFELFRKSTDYFYSVYKEKDFVGFVRFRQNDTNTFMYYKVNPNFEGHLDEKKLMKKAEKLAQEALLATNIIHEWSSIYTYHK
ncbi:ASCH domain-containing protein [Bacillus timonensis]|uniref:ASCH domain-containing protein n=1 Tax=Bacillus timonensis TaxID=1033734 RepID=A0A4S3PWF4_9BACI|nr:ASCH domain-containing protein [Bacillus timonensis]THE14177.1 ASCH domain-containing protein [Bacillus timonensis]